MDKRESAFWNITKGFAIFLMIWGHCIQYCAMDTVDFFEDIVFKAIYAFHMPLFMLVSGYLFFYSFRKRNLKDLLVHRVQSMLHPIIAATVLNNVLLLIPNYILSNRADILFGALFEGIGYNFWFLWAVLISSVIVGTCCKISGNPAGRVMLVLAGAFGVLLMPQWDMTLFMYPYFAAGFFCGMYRDKAARLYRVLRYVAVLGFPVLLSFYETRHYIYLTPMYSAQIGLTASMKVAAFRWLTGFAGSIWMLAILELICHLANSVGMLKKLLSGLTVLGKNSLQIYCLSVPLLSGYLPHLYAKLMEFAGDNLFARNIVVFDFLFTPLLAVAWSAGLYLAVVVLRKVKLHALIFGR